MKIAFYSPHLCLRGTTVALYDYAYHNQSILNNESFVIYDEKDRRNDASVVRKFTNSFSSINALDNNCSLDAKLKRLGADAVYILKSGRNDERKASVCKNLIHCTGMENDPHGDVYAYVSKWLSQSCSGGTHPYVPHIVDLPDENGDLRAELKIPDSALVFGRTGGRDTWSLPFTTSVITETLNEKSNYYFIFQNTEPFIDHERVIFIESTADMIYKTKFINSCDAMIHARFEGESFGLACGEFSIRNKPVITWSGSNERNHIEVLGEKGLLYSSAKELLSLLLNFERKSSENWNCYEDFSPAKVMKKFKQVFLD